MCRWSQRVWPKSIPAWHSSKPLANLNTNGLQRRLALRDHAAQGMEVMDHADVAMQGGIF